MDNRIKHYCPNTPFLIVSSRSDLRRDKQIMEKSKFTGFISKYKVEELVKESGALGYVECSSLTGEGVSELIPRVIQLKKEWEEKKEKQNGKCTLC